MHKSAELNNFKLTPICAQAISMKSINYFYLAPLLLIFLPSPAAHASSVFWHSMYSGENPPRYPSPEVACQTVIERLNQDYTEMNNDPTIFVNFIYVYYPSFNTATCMVRFASTPDTIYNYEVFILSGNPCQNNLAYNENTGECAGDSQKGSPDMCPSAVSGASINSAIANTFQVETDFQNSSVYSIQFLRTYNSLDGLWRHNYSTHLMVTGTVIALVMADGRESFFSFDGTTAVAAPTELGQLTKTGDIWLYTAKNSDTYSFDATGRLTRWTNAAGAEQLLDYVNGTVTVTDNLGKSLSFTEDAQHQPLTLSAPGLTIQYDYNANQRLSGLTRTRGGEAEQRQFHYEDASNNALLTGITDERGVRYVTWAYDDQDRAISSEYAGGAGSSMVTYNADGSSTITNEFGKKATYRFQDINGIRRVSAIEGEALGSCPNSNSTYSYDTRGLITSKIDNMGIYTSYDYNERGLEISRTEAAGTPQARTITTTWHATLNLPLMVTEPGRITTYTYDAQGRQLSQTSTALD